VIDRESNRVDRWITEAIFTSEKNRTSFQTETRGPANFHTSIITFCPPQQHLVDSRFEEGSSGCIFQQRLEI